MATVQRFAGLKVSSYFPITSGIVKCNPLRRSRKLPVKLRRRESGGKILGSANALIGWADMYFLLKTEPSVYSFANLQREKETIWDGVTNPAAVKTLREMNAGDELVIYHTGDEKRAVGTASVIAVDAADPKTPLVKIEVGKEVPHSKTLAEMKSDSRFAESPLLRQSRLSVVPLTSAQYKFLVE